MKKIIIGLLFLSLYSCSNELDLYPSTGLSPDAITPSDLPALERGMYNNVQNDPRRESWIFYDIIGGNVQGTTTTSKDVINNTLNPLNSLIVNGWKGYYSALYQVNNVLSITANLPKDQTTTRVSGTAYYFRAYIYYSLVTRWGDVPLLLENSLEKPSRTDKSLVWQQIEADLEMAQQLLSDSKNYYYVSKDAVVALQARVMLSQNKLDKASELAESLIESGKYALDSFEKIFRKQDNSEVIFAFENLSSESSITISTLFYNYGHPNKGSYVYAPSKEILSLIKPEDKRHAISFVNAGGQDCINKYPSGQTGTDPVIISRLAEMYLISAEASSIGLATKRLNQLREKRGLDPVYPSNKQQMLELVLKERRMELLAEGFSYYDYVRTGKATEHLGLLDYQHLLPIPGGELQLNPNLTPNPGY
ncbi:RagB/SusD family nutrient uptake outer membrane protein [Myroides pelagicus]|uniref:RagB/SusD family nutrient uptake outer membrane protein n=1 Tax=Myroides pelagicus TaxID=270914 RepID=A0A7K1GNC8_9FLAO|nr:RagB/SusD family nutrient uptake outer membrane protein [Myroides pelagicus]MEC4114865.1 RagB/SusD family nutrient uptake outer membrane protein [Myroides pelagicus]MTH30356.1 RagB/SusD family nutrient uptake outer membrane protein [Myroides pelagicus]